MLGMMTVTLAAVLLNIVSGCARALSVVLSCVCACVRMCACVRGGFQQCLIVVCVCSVI